MKHVNKNFRSLLLFLFAAILASPAIAQTGAGTDNQRLEVMRQKLETIRRSATSAISALREDAKDDESKKEDPSDPDNAITRLRSVERDAERTLSDVNNIRGRIDRAEKYEASEITSLEEIVAEFQKTSDNVMSETAAARAVTDSPEGRPRETKKKGKFLGIFGRGGTDEFDELMGSVTPGRDRQLFIVATREIRKKNYDVGRLLFQTIITTYPDSPYLPMAKLAVADSFFLEGSTSALIQAIAAYNDWLTFFPTHPLADRVVLKIGESEMRQIGLPDRDASRARRAEVRLKALLQSYPNSILKEEAELRLAEVQNNLAMHNMLIANHYYTLSVSQGKGGLKGAQSRYLEIIDKYDKFENMDEVLYKIANTYLLEEETDQAARYFQRIVRDYPNSDYVAKSKEQLELVGATVPEPNQERMNVLPPEKVSFFKNFRNQLFGIYPMTIDRNGVLMTRDFDREKFELIDQIIENQGDIYVNQIPRALTTVISQRQPETQPMDGTPEEK